MDFYWVELKSSRSRADLMTISQMLATLNPIVLVGFISSIWITTGNWSESNSALRRMRVSSRKKVRTHQVFVGKICSIKSWWRVSNWSGILKCAFPSPKDLCCDCSAVRATRRATDSPAHNENFFSTCSWVHIPRKVDPGLMHIHFLHVSLQFSIGYPRLKNL